MQLKHKLTSNSQRCVIGTALTVGIGLLFWWTPLGGFLENLSYDLAVATKPTVVPEGAVIIEMDDPSYQILGQDPERWDRSLHARLLDKLTMDHAKVVVFDIVLSDPGTPEANQDLARAIKKNGKVALAARLERGSRSGLLKTEPVRPNEEFLAAGGQWGLAEVVGGELEVKRKYYFPDELNLAPSLAWVAAAITGAALPEASDAAQNCWLNYYGPNETVPSVSYFEATNQPPGYFKDKLVFIGANVRAQRPGHWEDRHPTPYSFWIGEMMPGVEVAATATLNLAHGKWLRRLSTWGELLVVLLCGVGFGGGLSLARPFLAGTFGLLGALALGAAAVWVVSHDCVWFAWAVPAVIQVPVALGWALYARRRKGFGEEPKVQPAARPGILAADGKSTVVDHGPGSTTRRIPIVPDHELLRTVGKGSYGEVWLARNVVGLYHAVKIVYRQSFQDAEPYEREFHGIQKFMPVSRDHPNLVNLLHVGRNDAEGYFFYIMESADDEVAGRQIDSATYSPRHLAREFAKQHRFSVAQTVELGLNLASALSFLHENHLIHRDIKPSNIIYVNGVPKIADIGLVAELRTNGQLSTYIGTEGYIPPEGPGTPGADIYGLGKVLYEAATGFDRSQFPDLPSTFVSRPAENVVELNTIILRACEHNPQHRYQSAAALQADLRRLHSLIPPE
jgi:CHASE2 domain-containing sensor protein